VGLLALSTDGDERLDAHPLVREHFAELLRREQPAAWREGHRRLYEHLKRKSAQYPETIEEMAPLYTAVVHGCMANMPEKFSTMCMGPEFDGGNLHSTSTILEPSALRSPCCRHSSIHLGRSLYRVSARRIRDMSCMRLGLH